MRVVFALALTASSVMTLSPATAATEAVRCGGQRVTLVGTSGDDVIVGTNGPDVIHGLAGRDVIKGFGGNDVICGGGGRDTLWGGAGDDALFGGPAQDSLRGGAGFDVVQGGSSDDVLVGGPDGDVLRGGAGEDVAAGGGGADVCYAALSEACGEKPTDRRNKLAALESLLPGQQIRSAGGRVVLRVKRNGNVELIRDGIDVWDTDTDRHRNARLSMSAGGELTVMWRGEAVWSTGTASEGAFARLGRNANLTVKSAAAVPLWDRRSNPGMIDWHLPYPIGESWHAGAPHGENLSALDFGPNSGVGQVVSVASGTMGWYQCETGGQYIKIEHGGGYASSYYHLVNIRTDLVGEWIEAGTVIGEAGNAVPCG
ncbi:MAG: peptidoglycan DD-metalloendopeptidase family protein, partial [Acidimicrobiia bacterium]|nr:peptidoglycan DD-metalloendopeptidase family protein [Acidimicrobiia bacterium]